ncbi:Calcium-binding endonuclease/exonuclease/phosphatase family [Perilla frutescens var. hirtella]|nr:Calcium-binding endonuclease/exonuclease/phosphatase family [Perilla frutescens var. hirtella]KAH6809736.1 Calcium-binding endonuclease/exonuclease/phosphatase family [Perilla frutescens var. frutescens]KAH6815407.1 Calcium-binding endonuclease/exonuclease/phosphatase family [Perilla frutescens var. frutescens]
MGRKNNGRVSRIGSYAIASSITDDTCFSCTTFNILAPIYKRLSHEDPNYRESDVKQVWLKRNKMILDWLLCERSSIICLQEFWVGNEELVSIYNKRLGDAGYNSFKLARTNNRGDGLLIAVHKDYFRVISHKELLFNDVGDRVAQLLHVELIPRFSQCRSNNICQEILIVNTHLLFPHDSSLCLERLRQIYKILHYVESYQKENKLNPLPILLCGDLNGSKSGHVYKFLRSLGFISSYDAAHMYTDADAHRWVSHRNHRGNICGVDFIWLLNPNRYRKLLRTSWGEALSGMLKYQLKRALFTEDSAFAFLRRNDHGHCITYLDFCEALQQLNLIGHCYGLHTEEIRELWVQADVDGNGVLDYEEFKQRIWNAYSGQGEKVSDGVWDDAVYGTEQTIGFSIKNAVLFPTEVEKGLWPEDYSLSDHARLTVVFSPVRMPCSRVAAGMGRVVSEEL